jgi:hypothetical protein
MGFNIVCSGLVLGTGFSYIDSACTAQNTPLLMYCWEGMFTAPFPSNGSLLLQRGPHRKHFYRILACACVCWTVYRALAWQRVDHICYNIVTCMSDSRLVLDWRLDLLTILTHDSWLHLIIAPSFISTLYSSLLHTLSFFQSAFNSRFPITDLNNGDSTTAPIKSSLHRLPYNWLNLSHW